MVGEEKATKKEEGKMATSQREKENSCLLKRRKKYRT